VCNIILFNCHVMKLHVCQWCAYSAVVILLCMLQLHFFKNRRPWCRLKRRLAEATIEVDEMVRRTTPATTWNQTNCHTKFSQICSSNFMWDSTVLISCDIKWHCYSVCHQTSALLDVLWCQQPEINHCSHSEGFSLDINDVAAPT